MLSKEQADFLQKEDKRFIFFLLCAPVLVAILTAVVSWFSYKLGLHIARKEVTAACFCPSQPAAPKLPKGPHAPHR